ncbi:hypothetical protein DVH24_021899, partial [Malus domestica]
ISSCTAVLLLLLLDSSSLQKLHFIVTFSYGDEIAQEPSSILYDTHTSKSTVLKDWSLEQ